ncbi:hypothetical protein AB4Y89_23415 [Terriglobus sp. 2YAB30_2]|uniref:hypothetical protein n=1 Tax=unclassified Terriglobus TaxID=2628988 RepID=UPI003F96C6D1
MDAVIGEGEDWREIVDKGDPQHHLLEEYVVAFHRQGLPDPLLIVMAKYPGGSDCRYKPALFGEVDGRVTQLTSAIPDYDTRGGAFLYTRAGSTVLTVTSERYQEHDVHYLGPSRMAVYRYAWDGARFILKSKAQVSTDAVRTPGEKLDDLFGQALGC